MMILIEISSSRVNLSSKSFLLNLFCTFLNGNKKSCIHTIYHFLKKKKKKKNTRARTQHGTTLFRHLKPTSQTMINSDDDDDDDDDIIIKTKDNNDEKEFKQVAENVTDAVMQLYFSNGGSRRTGNRTRKRTNLRFSRVLSSKRWMEMDLFAGR